MELVLFIGVQGAGKSSLYAQRFLHTHVRVSLDVLRTRHREWQFVETCLRTRARLVVDNTNPTRVARARYIEPAVRARFHVVAYWFDVALSDAIGRNAARTGRDRVPEKAVRATHAKLEPPTEEEGFHERHWVRLTATGFEMGELD